jgi:hypothetical protein
MSTCSSTYPIASLLLITWTCINASGACLAQEVRSHE